LYKTCCTKFYKCGFCYDTPTPTPDDKCPAVMQIADKDDKKFKSCCAEHMIEESEKEDANRENADTVKCCTNFKCTFKTNTLCLPKPVPIFTCDESDINNPDSLKHKKCCEDPKYKKEAGCAKCNANVMKEVNDPKHAECCKEKQEECCTESVFGDPAHKDYDLCCGLAGNEAKCCKKGW
jgi:hypothetical protein